MSLVHPSFTASASKLLIGTVAASTTMCVRLVSFILSTILTYYYYLHTITINTTTSCLCM